MNIKKLLQVFLGSWAVLIFLVVLTDTGDLSPAAQVGYTGVLAVLIALLAVAATRGEKKKCFCIHEPGNAEALYRVEGEWIYKGKEEKANWYIKRNAVYGFENMTPLYRVKDGKITKEGETEPSMRVEENKIISCETGEVIYEIKE